MSHSHPIRVPRPATESSFDRLLGLIQDLIEVIEEENRLLASGIPASMTATTAAKTRLAEEIDTMMIEAADQLLAAQQADPERRLVLVGRIAIAERVVAENVTRLAAAIQATRRRVGAVMAAIREQVASESHCYAGDGRMPSRYDQRVSARGRCV